jgi:hypothetical protein
VLNMGDEPLIPFPNGGMQSRFRARFLLAYRPSGGVASLVWPAAQRWLRWLIRLLVTREIPLNLQARIDTLKDRHANLEERLASEDRRPAPDSETMSLLKREKLRLKEEMARLAASGGH